MTYDDLYEYGMKSEPARVCIPRELVQSLPKLERINGKIVLQYWYYFYNVSFPGTCVGPLYYAAFDPEADKLVEFMALTDEHAFMKSWLDMVGFSENMREVKYLKYCADLLARGDITDAEIVHTQALWLDAQARDIFPYLYRSVRPEAREELLSPHMAGTSRYLVWIWRMESLKYQLKKKEGYETLAQIWDDPVLKKEWDVFLDFLNRGPAMGSRSKREF